MSKKHGGRVKRKPHPAPLPKAKPSTSVESVSGDQPAKSLLSSAVESGQIKPLSVPKNGAVSTSTDGHAFPNYTQAPGSRIPTYSFTCSTDATTVPAVGETEQIVGELAKSPSELADKYVFSQFRKRSAVLLIPLVPIIWIFVQDNGAGRLQSREGVISCLIKCGIVLLLCSVPLVLTLFMDRR